MRRSPVAWLPWLADASSGRAAEIGHRLRERGVDLVDHLVLGAIGRWVSLKALGGW